MRIVFAGEKAPKTIEFLSNAGCLHKLVSYEYPRQFLNWMKVLKNTKKANGTTTMLLDSGAFSSWNKGSEVDIDMYIQYIKDTLKYDKVFEEYTIINLDVIPGKPGQVPTPKMVEDSAVKGWYNMRYMNSKLDGRPVMHTFHQGEDFKWLDKMVEKKLDYIGISPANDRTTKQKKQWLDDVFTRITDDEGWPVIRTHGLAVTAFDLITQYPFFSLDSTTWALVGSYGSILMPHLMDDGTWDYSRRANQVTMSNENPSRKDRGRHYENLTEGDRDVVNQYLKYRGYKAKDCMAEYNTRDQLNMLYFLGLQDYVKDKPFKKDLTATLF